MFQNHLSWLVVVCISKKHKIFFYVIYSGCSFNGKVVCKGVIARVSLGISFKFMFKSFLSSGEELLGLVMSVGLSVGLSVRRSVPGKF